MSIIIVEANRELADDGYHLTWAVASHSGINPDIFVHKVEDGSFTHVASVRDMLEYGVTSEQGSGFYRQASASITTRDALQAISLVDIVKKRIDILVKDFDETMNGFLGTEISSHSF